MSAESSETRELKDDEYARLTRTATLLRRDSIEMTSHAGSGHPTTAMSAADLVAVLFFREMRYEVDHPSNPNNDRFILSKGHGAPLLYAAWAAAGAFPAEHLEELRSFGSPLEGHPTPRFPWADVATGSLGQGLSVGVGMALAGRLDGRRFRVFVLLGDGETSEGAVWEAAAVASRNGLGNLVAIVDVNGLGQTQETMLGDDLQAHAARFEAFGWRVRIVDGHDVGDIARAYDRIDEDPQTPLAIIAKTIKGKGVGFVEDDPDWHGKALEPGARTDRALRELPLDEEATDVRPQVRSPEGAEVPDPSTGRVAPIAPPDYELGGACATRTAYGTALAKLVEADDRILVVDGDVMDSTRTAKAARADPGRLIEGYIAEQNMVGMAVGLQALGKIPFVATFASFLTRAFDIIRMAAISRARMVLCGSHAGVSVGEDGPSQMGLEDLAMMRSIPDSVVLYPADAVSTERLVAEAASNERITYIRTTRPKLPVLYGAEESFHIGGSKVHRPSPRDQVAIIAAGVTVREALAAQHSLASAGISARVIDLYSIKPLDKATLLEAARATSAPLLTVEDHYGPGGLGEAVAASMAPFGVPVFSLAVRDIPTSGTGEELLSAACVDARAIEASATELAGLSA